MSYVTFQGTDFFHCDKNTSFTHSIRCLCFWTYLLTFDGSNGPRYMVNMVPMSFWVICVILHLFASFKVFLSPDSMAQNESKWLNWVWSIPLRSIRIYCIILSHFESLWVSLSHFESASIWLKMPQSVSKLCRNTIVDGHQLSVLS